MMIQGKSCTLTVAKDGYYYPLPYSEETVRQASKGYALPGVIGIRNREKLVETGKAITGCVVTRLEYNNILALFLLLFYSDDKFDILVDRVCEKLIYKNVSVKEFEIRAENKEAFYFRFDVKENEDSYVTGWDITTPSLTWNQCAHWSRNDSVIFQTPIYHFCVEESRGLAAIAAKPLIITAPLWPWPAGSPWYR